MLGKTIQKKYLLVFLLLFINATTGYSKSNSTFENLSAKQSAELIQEHQKNPEFIIIDLRTNGEIAGGKLKNSIQYDYMKPGFMEKLNSLDRTKTYLIYCQSGYRSEKTFNLMQRFNFKNVFHMNRGFISWASSGLPVKY